MENKPQFIVVHHTATDRRKTTFAAVNEYHRKKWNFKSKLGFYIGYHYFIDGNGVITHGRDNLEAGAHTSQGGMNYKSIGVCLAGNFDIESPSTEQTVQLAELMYQVSKAYGIPAANVHPHRKYAPKSCYGRNLPDLWAQNLLVERLQRDELQGQVLVEKARDIVDILGYDRGITAAQKAEVVDLLTRALDKAKSL